MFDMGVIGGADGPTIVYSKWFPGEAELGGIADKLFLNGDPTAAILVVVAISIVAYFIGNISPSTLLAKAKGIDIKKEGSGNAGTTNALRVMGKKAAIITLVIDILKGVVAVGLGWLMGGQIGAMLCVLCVMLGHVWPILLRFQGGKGIATSFGALLTLDPVIALIELGIVAIGTLISKRMSVGSVAGLALLPLVAYFRMPAFLWISVIMAAVMIFKHRANLVRLIHGEESKLSFLDRGPKDTAGEGKTGENTEKEPNKDAAYEDTEVDYQEENQ